MRIAFGLVGIGLGGGVMTSEAPFVFEIKHSENVTARVFEFGRRGYGDNSNVARFFGLLMDLFRFTILLATSKPDLIHLNSAYFRPALLRDPAYVAISRIFGVRVFIKYHGSDVDLLVGKSLLWKVLGRFCVKSAAGIGVLSSEEKLNFKIAGHPMDKIRQVKNVVNCQKFEGAERALRTDGQLLVISRFIPGKGVIESIEAMAMITVAAPQVTLVCVGDGPDRRQAENRVRDLNLDKKVVFTGRVSEEAATEFYLNSSALVFPTYFNEGFPMTLFQAVAAGLPIITTRIRAAADYLHEPENCLWVTPRSAHDLAERVLYLLANPCLMHSMSNNNRELAQRFSPKRIVPEYLDIYEQLINQTN